MFSYRKAAAILLMNASSEILLKILPGYAIIGGGKTVGLFQKTLNLSSHGSS